MVGGGGVNAMAVVRTAAAAMASRRESRPAGGRPAGMLLLAGAGLLKTL